MVVVAVAGGTGKLGRTLVEAIVATGKHSVRILARKPNPGLESEIGVPIIIANYDNIAELTKSLEDNNVHTVVSAISMMPSPTGEDPKETALIRAADASTTTKRLISSDWGISHTEDQSAHLPSVPYKLQAQEELKKVTDLETTRVVNGFFMDYWGYPGVESRMGPMTLFIDVANNAAAIPGTGDVAGIFSHTADVAKLVAASLDLQKWDPVSYLIGDKVTWNEFLGFAENAKGTKFQVAYDGVDKLRRGEPTELPGQVQIYEYFPKEMFQGIASVFGLWFAEGLFDITPERSLNDSFPEIKTLKVEDMLNKAWKTV